MEICKSIVKYDFLLENSLSEEYFFKDIMAACKEKGLLEDKILNRIFYERFEALRVQLKYYTKDESSSVMIEAAESLMEGIDYTIGIYLKSFANIDLILEELKNTSFSDMLKMGNALIKKKILDGKRLLHKIQENKLKVYNYSYNDTIDYGISLFFKDYDDFFAAHETPGSIDYQLFLDNTNYKGIEYIYNYLEILSLENEFCYKYDISEINELLKGYDKNCELLLINIFELVLINSLGLIICGKTLKSLNINSMDREIIKNELSKLSIEELQIVLLKYADRCCKVIDIKNTALINYVREAVLKLASLISSGIKLNTLEKVFISFREEKDNEFIEYYDGEKLDDAAFRRLTENIREGSSIQHKITLIKNNIKSLEDLVDMLGSECLFEDEFTILFKSLSQMEIILLSKHVSELPSGNGYEKEWHLNFNKYISNLSKEEQETILKLKEKILLI